MRKSLAVSAALALAIALASSGAAFADDDSIGETDINGCVLVQIDENTSVLACGEAEIESVRTRGSGGRF